MVIGKSALAVSAILNITGSDSKTGHWCDIRRDKNIGLACLLHLQIWRDFSCHIRQNPFTFSTGDLLG